MKVAVSAQGQGLRVHLTSAVLERPELELHVLAFDNVDDAASVGASVALIEWPSGSDRLAEARICELAGRIPVIAVAAELDRQRAATSLSFGVRGLLLAERNTRTIQSAIFSILDGGSWIDPRILPALVARDPGDLIGFEGATTSPFSLPLASTFEAKRPTRDGTSGVTAATSLSRAVEGMDQLTGREKQVAGLIGKGLTNQEIAQHLGVDESTVKSHIGSILRKVQLRDRLQVALWFHGLPIGHGEVATSPSL